MGLLDVFKRSRSGHSGSSIALGPRTFALVIAGHGFETRPRLPCAAAHLADGTLVFGPYDLPAARSSGQIKNVLIKPGAPPTGTLEKRSMSDSSIVTYSTAQRGTTQLVLGTGMRDHGEVLEAIGIAAHPAGWRIVTDQIDVAWPARFSLRASGDVHADHGPFALAYEGAATDTIHFYGPLTGTQLPAPENLNAGGGVRIDAGQLDGVVRGVKHYTFEGDATAQRYYYVHLDATTVYLVRARASIAKAAIVFAGADALCASLQPRHELSR